jgi:hypothetical protein
MTHAQVNKRLGCLDESLQAFEKLQSIIPDSIQVGRSVMHRCKPQSVAPQRVAPQRVAPQRVAPQRVAPRRADRPGAHWQVIFHIAMLYEMMDQTRHAIKWLNLLVARMPTVSQ